MRRLLLVSSAVAALAAGGLAAAAPANRERPVQIRPSIGIGKVRLDMTLAQVRRALGPPMTLNRRVKLGFGREHREYMWNWSAWTVAFRGRPGELRAVRIATQLRGHRFRGTGVGSRVRALVRLFPSATCRSFYPGGTQVVVRTRSERELRFEVAGPPSRGPIPPRGPVRVWEVVVQDQLPPYGVQIDFKANSPCVPGWRRG